MAMAHSFGARPTRRSLLALIATVPACGASFGAYAAPEQVVSVHKDPSCGCCTGWVQHLQGAGFTTKVIDTRELDPLKRRLGVPDDLAACHTAEVAGYVIEGHVPAGAIQRLLRDRPKARGLAVPGMPVGSPGMEGGTPERFDVVLFGPEGRQTFMTFVGDRLA
jgi:hypothetical protein